MSNEAIKIMTPVGRLVQGHPIQLNEVRDDRTGQPKMRADGTPRKEVFMALAFDKATSGFMETVWPAMVQAAQRDWPGGQFNSPAFAWKVIDGDGVDTQGRPHAEKEGFAGCHVLRIASGFQFQVVGPDGRQTVTDLNAVKRGDYMRVYIGIRGNGSQQTPGLYVNPDFAQVCGYGEAILSGPDVASVLAQAAPVNLPAGASATPTAGAMPQVQGAPVAPVAQPAAAAPVAQPAAAAPVAQPAAAAPVAQPAAAAPVAAASPASILPPQ